MPRLSSFFWPATPPSQGNTASIIPYTVSSLSLTHTLSLSFPLTDKHTLVLSTFAAPPSHKPCTLSFSQHLSPPTNTPHNTPVAFGLPIALAVCIAALAVCSVQQDTVIRTSTVQQRPDIMNNRRISNGMSGKRQKCADSACEQGYEEALLSLTGTHTRLKAACCCTANTPLLRLAEARRGSSGCVCF